MWELDHKENWLLKNWCFWTVVLEKTLESPLDCKGIQPVHSIGNQSWIFIGRTGAEAETPLLWPPDVKSWLIGKDPDGGEDWRWEEKGTTEVEMIGWHHQLHGHEFEQAPGVGDGQGGLVCCSPWGCKGLDMTERLHWTWSSLVPSECFSDCQHHPPPCHFKCWFLAQQFDSDCLFLHPVRSHSADVYGMSATCQGYTRGGRQSRKRTLSWSSWNSHSNPCGKADLFIYKVCNFGKAWGQWAMWPVKSTDLGVVISVIPGLLVSFLRLL